MLILQILLNSLILQQLVIAGRYSCDYVENSGPSCNDDRTGYFTCSWPSNTQTNFICPTGTRCSCHRNLDCEGTVCRSYTVPPKFINTGLLTWRGKFDYYSITSFTEKQWAVALRTDSGLFFKQDWLDGFTFIIPNGDRNDYTKYTGNAKSKRCQKTQVKATESLTYFDLSEAVLVLKSNTERKYEHKYDFDESTTRWTLTTRYDGNDNVIIPTHYHYMHSTGYNYGDDTTINRYYTYVKKINARVEKKYSLNQFCTSFY